jgi:hypothetical protein
MGATTNARIRAVVKKACLQTFTSTAGSIRREESFRQRGFFIVTASQEEWR